MNTSLGQWQAQLQHQTDMRNAQVQQMANSMRPPTQTTCRQNQFGVVNRTTW
jgi:hypothetical protein